MYIMNEYRTSARKEIYRGAGPKNITHHKENSWAFLTQRTESSQKQTGLAGAMLMPVAHLKRKLHL